MSLIGKSIGNYQIKDQLGEGGMGTVYLGEHPLIGKRVAVKVLREELAAKEDIVVRFFHEAKAVNDIGHQNIVDVVDFGRLKAEAGPDLVYFIMELLDGESLASRLRRTGLAFAETQHIILQCCSALAASHKKGIIHRDLKPENIHLSPRGGDVNFVKLLDFGIAKLTSATDATGNSSHKTRTGLVIGTPAYMSPEQCEGKGQIDHRSDIYSLGVVMFELLTGQLPFPGEGFGEILVAHLTQPPPRPTSINPAVTPGLEWVALRALEKDKARRFQSMEEFAAALADAEGLAAREAVALGGTRMMEGAGRGPVTGVNTRPTTLSGAAAAVEELAPRAKRTPLVAAIAVLLVAAAGGGFYFMRARALPSPVPPRAAAVAALPAPPTMIHISVSSDPAGARVMRGSEDLGKTPLSFQLKKGAPAFALRFTLDGYRPHDEAVSTEMNKDIAVVLAKLPPPVPAVAAPVAPAHSSVRHHAHKHEAARPKAGKADDDGLLTPDF